MTRSNVVELAHDLILAAPGSPDAQRVLVHVYTDNPHHPRAVEILTEALTRIDTIGPELAALAAAHPAHEVRAAYYAHPSISDTALFEGAEGERQAVVRAALLRQADRLTAAHLATLTTPMTKPVARVVLDARDQGFSVDVAIAAIERLAPVPTRAGPKAATETINAATAWVSNPVCAERVVAMPSIDPRVRLACFVTLKGGQLLVALRRHLADVFAATRMALDTKVSDRALADMVKEMWFRRDVTGSNAATFVDFLTSDRACFALTAVQEKHWIRLAGQGADDLGTDPDLLDATELVAAWEDRPPEQRTASAAVEFASAPGCDQATRTLLGDWLPAPTETVPEWLDITKKLPLWLLADPEQFSRLVCDMARNPHASMRGAASRHLEDVRSADGVEQSDRLRSVVDRLAGEPADARVAFTVWPSLLAQTATPVDVLAIAPWKQVIGALRRNGSRRAAAHLAAAFSARVLQVYDTAPGSAGPALEAAMAIPDQPVDLLLGAAEATLL